MAPDDIEQRARDLLQRATPTPPVGIDEEQVRRGARRRRSRTGLAAGLAVLALVVGTGVAVTALTDDRKDAAPVEEVHDDWRWVAFRDVEVKVPPTWWHDYETLLPGCVQRPLRRGDPWASDVPRAPYVTVGTPSRPVPMIGCLGRPKPGDPDPAFGALPFELWQPFVKLDLARPDLDRPERDEGTWEHRGWHLTRRTTHGVQITVLAQDPDVAKGVFDSLRTVETTALGCPTNAPLIRGRFPVPVAAPVPRAEDVEAVAICQYARADAFTEGGLEASRRLAGDDARRLTTAIHAAPRVGGPDTPDNCVKDMVGDRALLLRFFGDEGDALGEAYVYYDWCFGNGIVDSTGSRRLTRESCSPLFAEPPISLWSGQQPVVKACGPLGER